MSRAPLYVLCMHVAFPGQSLAHFFLLFVHKYGLVTVLEMPHTQDVQALTRALCYTGLSILAPGHESIDNPV